MPATLPRPPQMLRLNDLRRNKRARAFELLGTLTPFQTELLDTLQHGGTVFGGTNSDIAVVSLPRDKGEGRCVEGGMKDVNLLVRHGWLRFAKMTGEGSGWFWMTDASERLWNVLGR